MARLAYALLGLLLPVLLPLLLLVVAPTAKAQNLESVLSPGTLIKGHAKWDDSCRSCHTPGNRKGQDRLCMDCHKEVARDMADKTGFHGRQAPAACRSCHTDHRGRNAVIVDLDPKTFDHKQTDYLLKGKHAKVKCESCHEKGKPHRVAPHECNACHKKDDVHKGTSGTQCQDCHHEQDWKDTPKFDHDKARFALKGSHEKVKCESCHKDQRYRETPSTCVGCHKKEDKHKGQYGEKCESCHGEKRWKDLHFDHDVDTKYPLRDKHRDVKCKDCHTGHLYRDKTPTACYDCHKKDDKHKESLGKDCASCHSERGWNQVNKFDHDRTAFPLAGKHLKADCKDCHKSLVYREAPSTCFGCHEKDDEHKQNLGKRCGDCHNEGSWKVQRFDHQRTEFPLRGAHARPDLKCASCHVNARSYRGIPKLCIDCHKKDEPHGNQLSTKCESCHVEKNWKVERYDHNLARFTLQGAHAVTKCESCHKTQRYREAPRTCVGCHEKDDRHKGRLGAECTDCHNVRAWKLARFDHDKSTDYPLVGAHIKVRCESCHTQPARKGQKVAPTPTTCVGCHLKDDAHDRAFGTQCERCHQPTDWRKIEQRGVPASRRPS